MHDMTTLIAAVRNEGPFLIEWVAYHRVLGFDNIVIFGDDSIDGTSDLLVALAANNAIIYHPNPGTGGHRNRAYEKAFALPLVADADWVMTLDTDEFLNVHIGGNRLPDLLARVADADAISLPWRLFGHAGITAFEDSPVLGRFVQAAPLDLSVSDRQYGLKTLVRPRAAKGLGPHRPVIADGRTADDTLWVNGSGNDVTANLISGGWKASPDTAGYDLAQINAYAVRSSEVFALHNLRAPPLGSKPTSSAMADFVNLNTNHETDQSISDLKSSVEDEITRLYTLPGVAAAHTACVQSTAALIATMRQTSALDPDDPITKVCDRDDAKQLLRDQQALLACARTTGREAPERPTTTVIDTADIAPRWLADLRRSDFRRGWYQSDTSFAVQFTQRDPKVLVVSFDNLSTVNDASLAREAWGYGFYAAEGWSHMGVMAFEKNWYRDDALFDLMEAQNDLFAQFDTVVMTGTSMGAYAATAFADLAPGCTVLAYSPQATLDQKRVPWEKRFGGGRRQDWSGRYANGPDYCGQACNVFIVYDPYFEPDRRHAELYTGGNVGHLKIWYASHKSAQFMRRADILKPVMQEAVAGTLTAARYYALLRSRRELVWYHEGLADHVLAGDHPRLADLLADHLDFNDRAGLASAVRERLAGEG